MKFKSGPVRQVMAWFVDQEKSVRVNLQFKILGTLVAQVKTIPNLYTIHLPLTILGDNAVSDSALLIISEKLRENKREGMWNICTRS